jgi:hypothetical protein
MVRWLVHKDLDEMRRDLIEALSGHFPWGTKKNTQKILVSIASAPAEIRTEHLPNWSLQRYRYNNLLYDVENIMTF